MALTMGLRLFFFYFCCRLVQFFLIWFERPFLFLITGGQRLGIYRHGAR
jgi:hypothetical protein